MDQPSPMVTGAGFVADLLRAISDLVDEYPPYWTIYLVLGYEIVTQDKNKLSFAIQLGEFLHYIPQIAQLHNTFAGLVNSRQSQIFLSPDYVAVPDMEEIPGVIPLSV